MASLNDLDFQKLLEFRVAIRGHPGQDTWYDCTTSRWSWTGWSRTTADHRGDD